MGPPPSLPLHSLPSMGLIPSLSSLLLFPALLLILTPLIPSSSNSFAAAAPPPPLPLSLPFAPPAPRPPGIYSSQARGGAATARDPSATAAPGTGPTAGNGVPQLSLGRFVLRASLPEWDGSTSREGTLLSVKGRHLFSRQLEKRKGMPTLNFQGHPLLSPLSLPLGPGIQAETAGGAAAVRASAEAAAAGARLPQVLAAAAAATAASETAAAAAAANPAWGQEAPVPLWSGHESC